jgi:hypothetical protein
LNKPFKIYFSLLILGALIGLGSGRGFQGNRIIASDCAEMASVIIRSDLPNVVANTLSEKEALELRHYRFKNSIWSKILNVRDFEI